MSYLKDKIQREYLLRVPYQPTNHHPIQEQRRRKRVEGPTKIGLMNFQIG